LGLAVVTRDSGDLRGWGGDDFASLRGRLSCSGIGLGLFVITRWLVGLVIPAVFIYMAYDCIKRRATQSATGILYVTGILIFIGEIIGLYLLRETRLPF
jgi:hypothetical protein